MRDFPASLAFDRDARPSPVVRKTYPYLRTVLDFVEIREVKLWALAERLLTDRESMSSALTWLAEEGYLVEHARGERGVRRFTLAWSLREEEITA